MPSAGATEGSAGVTPHDTEQATSTIQPILDDLGYESRSHPSDDVDGAKSESDIHGDEDRLLVSLDEFDGAFVLDAMCREHLFGVVGADDVNCHKDANNCSSESDIDDDNNGDFNSSDEGVEDVEEEAYNAEVDCTFDMSADDLREIGESG